MKKVYINYRGKEIPVTEPTIDVWKQVYKTKDMIDMKEVSLNLVSASTGIRKKDLNESEWFEIVEVANFLLEYYDNIETKFIETFEFKGKTYKFSNLDKLSFGLFIDIDTFLKRPEVEKIDNLHYYMALLYCGVDEDITDIEQRYKRAELFRDLPIRYYLGANSFFLRLEQILQRGIVGYLTRLKLRTKMGMLSILMIVNKVLTSFGVGIRRLVSWPLMILQRLMK